ncbi:MAG: hypothetical protein GX416_02410 [Bacteroidales bacterium]|nr:hypothetical protein [Bacteroidales bacterium]
MENIIHITNRIGTEVSNTLAENDSKLYFQEVVLLYSLAENLLKFLVASNDCWIKTCQRIDEADEKEKRGEQVNENDCYVNFETARQNVKKMNFCNVIEKAFEEHLINENLRIKLDFFRVNRNNLIHQLYLFDNRNDEGTMRDKLIEAEAVVEELIPIFKNLLFEKIGFTDSNLPEIFQPL